jgi:hypothetical protein
MENFSLLLRRKLPGSEASEKATLELVGFGSNEEMG